jgi:D-alanine-D-alanine ligase
MADELAIGFQSHLDYNRLNAAVLMGGVGEEREVSLQSGTCVAQALKESGVNVLAADVGPDDLGILYDGDIDVFFIALHGRFGEDGQLQKILEENHLVYTGSGPTASRLAFDKLASKKAFAEASVVVPRAIEFTADSSVRELEDHLRPVADRYVVKPIRQGSSVGVKIVDGVQSAIAAAQECATEFGDCMIEESIQGRLITVGVLGDQSLPIIEIRTKRDFYDYDAKYIDAGTEYLFNTIDDRQLTATIADAALVCFNVLGCRHFGRVDFILGEDRKAYVLEVNTIPGFTAHSLLPMAAAKAGYSMGELCVKIVEAALEEEPLVNRTTGSER